MYYLLRLPANGGMTKRPNQTVSLSHDWKIALAHIEPGTRIIATLPLATTVCNFQMPVHVAIQMNKLNK
jgi:hypothetical protein